MIAEREDVLSAYRKALATMDHDAALAHAADECGVSVDMVADAVAEEAMA